MNNTKLTGIVLVLSLCILALLMIKVKPKCMVPSKESTAISVVIDAESPLSKKAERIAQKAKKHLDNCTLFDTGFRAICYESGQNKDRAIKHAATSYKPSSWSFFYDNSTPFTNYANAISETRRALHRTRKKIARYTRENKNYFNPLIKKIDTNIFALDQLYNNVTSHDHYLSEARILALRAQFASQTHYTYVYC